MSFMPRRNAVGTSGELKRAPEIGRNRAAAVIPKKLTLWATAFAVGLGQARAGAGEAADLSLDARCERVCERVRSHLEAVRRLLQGVARDLPARSASEEDLARVRREAARLFAGSEEPSRPSPRAGEQPPGGFQPARAIWKIQTGAGVPGASEIEVEIEVSRFLRGVLSCGGEEETRGVEVFLLSGELVYEDDRVAETGWGIARLEVRGRDAARSLRDRIVREERGEADYVVLNSNTGRLHSRRVAWRRCASGNLEWAVVAGEEGDWAGPKEGEWTGYWAGAYAERVRQEEGGPEGESVRSGQLDVTVLQDGSRLELWTGPRAVAHGVRVGSHLAAARVEETAGGPPRVWYWRAEVDAERDTWRGELLGDACGRVVERSFHLRRAELR